MVQQRIPNFENGFFCSFLKKNLIMHDCRKMGLIAASFITVCMRMCMIIGDIA